MSSVTPGSVCSYTAGISIGFQLILSAYTANAFSSNSYLGVGANQAQKGPIPPGLERDGCGEKVAYCYRSEVGSPSKLFSLHREGPVLPGQSDFPLRAFNVSV